MNSSADVCAICLKNSTTPTQRTTVQRKTRNSKSTANESWESVWTEICAESACKLLDLQLDIFKEYFLTNRQCASCKQLLRDVDFVIRSIDSMNFKVSQLRIKLARLLYENIRTWTDENTEPKDRASESIENPIGNSEVDDEDSIYAGSLKLSSDLKEDFSEAMAGTGLESVPVPKITYVFQIQPDFIPCQTGHLVSIESSEVTQKNGQENPSAIEKPRSNERAVNEASSQRSSNRIRKPVQYRENTDEEESSEEHDSGSEIEERSQSNAKRKSSTVNGQNRCRTSVTHSIFQKNTQKESPADEDPEYVVSCEEEPEFGDEFSSESQTGAEPPNLSRINHKAKPTVKRIMRQRKTLLEQLLNGEEVIEYPVSKGRFSPLVQSATAIRRRRGRNGISCSPIRRATSKLPAHENFELLRTVKFLKQLEKEDTKKNSTFICKRADCGRRFVNPRTRRYHHVKEHGQLLFPCEFQCPFCDHYAPFDYMLDAHIIRVHQQQKHGYICPVLDCEMTFAANTKLISHTAYHHPELVQNKNDCSYTPQYHEKSLVGSSDAVLMPAVDSSVGSTKNDKVHAKDPLPYKCTQLDCTRAFKTENTLSAHMAINHGIAGKWTLAKCLFCSHRSLGQSTVNQHMRTSHHKNDAPKYYCKVCNLLFFATEHCQEHEKLHDNKGYRCVISKCRAKRFSHREELVAHVKREHDGSYRKKYICSSCGIARRTACALKIHMAIHSSDLPFKCNYCDKCFRNPVNRKSHHEIMHGDQLQKKTYNCKLCDATFTACQYLYKHNAWHKYGANANLPVAKKKQRNPDEEAIQDVLEAPEMPKRRLRSQAKQKC